MGSLWKKQSNVIFVAFTLTGGISTSQGASSHVNKNSVCHVIRQPHDMIDNLFIMRFYLPFNIPFVG